MERMVMTAGSSLSYRLSGRTVPAADFFATLGRRPVVVFAHGYNTTEAEAQHRAAVFRDLHDPNHAPDLVILRWPSEGRLSGYLEDRRHSKTAGPAIARFILDLAGRYLAAPVHLLAHSMGARAVKHGIRAAMAVRLNLSGLFQNLFWCAADIPADDLKPNGAAAGAHHLAEKVWSIYADDDRALKASRFLAAFRGRLTQRAGRSKPETGVWDPRVLAVDAGAVNNTYDGAMGHTYFCQAPDGQPGLIHHMIRQAATANLAATWPGGSITDLAVGYR